MLRGVTPRGELPQHGFLYRLAVRKVGRAARAAADEIPFVQGERRRQRGHFNEAADALRGIGRDAQPIPARADNFAIGADGDAAPVLRQRRRLAIQIARGLRFAFAAHVNRQRRDFRCGAWRFRQWLIIDLDGNGTLVDFQHLAIKGRVHQRLKMLPHHGFHIARIGQRRKRIGEIKPHRRTLCTHHARRRNPAPRCFVARGQMPLCRYVRRRTARFGDHILARQQCQLHAHTGKADALSARLAAGRKIVVLAQLRARHARSIVSNSEARGRGIGIDADQACACIERVGEYLREDGFLKRAGIGVAQILQQVQQVYAGFGHAIFVIQRCA